MNFMTLAPALIRKLFVVVALAAPLCAPLASHASTAAHLDRAPINLDDHESLRRGAKTFVDYCLTCHSSGYMRFARMTEIGFTEAQIKEKLLFTSDKVGDTMVTAMRPVEAKAWFGAAPPDLSVIARSRGSDWLYTYLRGFYRDESRAIGWNNTVFDKVGMPHVLSSLQGHQVAVMRAETAEDGQVHSVLDHLELGTPGRLSPAEYDLLVGDLVNYLTWMGEPSAATRSRIGVFVLLFLGIFLIIAYFLKKAYWKDIH